MDGHDLGGRRELFDRVHDDLVPTRRRDQPATRATVTTVIAPPATVAPGSTFPIEYRIDDQTFGPLDALNYAEPVNFTLLSNVNGSLLGVFNCENPVTITTPTEIDTTRTCTVAAGLHPGTYNSELSIFDELELAATTAYATTVT